MSELNTINLNGTSYTIGSTGQGVSDDLKAALLQIAEKTAYIDANGQTYYDVLYNALYPPQNVVSISAVYTQGGTTVYNTDSLSVLRDDLVVTATYDDSTTGVVTTYTLSGTLTVGTSTITASYAGCTDTFTVTVTQDVNSEVISTFNANCRPDGTTYENAAVSNEWTSDPGSVLATTVNFSWDTAECDVFQMCLYQYDSGGNPYKATAISRYSDNPITDGETYDTTTGAWVSPGGSSLYAALGGGNITINLPTNGTFKVALRRGGGSGSEVSSNATFGTWLTGGGITITAYI